MGLIFPPASLRVPSWGESRPLKTWGEISLRPIEIKPKQASEHQLTAYGGSNIEWVLEGESVQECRSPPLGLTGRAQGVREG